MLPLPLMQCSTIFGEKNVTGITNIVIQKQDRYKMACFSLQTLFIIHINDFVDINL